MRSTPRMAATSPGVRFWRVRRVGAWQPDVDLKVMGRRPGVELTVVSSRLEAAARCVVCGGDIPAGEGITALFEGRFIRFKCQGCLGWFAEDPNRFLAGHTERCCQDECGGSALTEWSYD